MIALNKRPHYPYIPISTSDQKEMLAEMGLKTIEDLFTDIPKECRMQGHFDLPDSHSEISLRSHVQGIAQKNQTDVEMLSFLGGGVCCDLGAEITNCVISGNKAWDGGGGLWLESGVSIANCTVIGN